MEEILTYLRDLRENNNREWFNTHKPYYLELKSRFEVFVGELIERIAEFDEGIRGLEVKDCVYRIYRDTRFSPDKTPYKVHFAAYMATRGGRNSHYAGYYFHLEPGNGLLGGGLYCPEPVLLKRIRQDIYDNIEEFTDILRDEEFVKEFTQLDDTGKLKKVPAPFPADFPEADLLKYKNYDVLSPKPDSFFRQKNLMEETLNVFRKLYRFNRFLNYTVEELYG